MNTEQYHAEVYGLRDAINSWKSCATDQERQNEIAILHRTWAGVVALHQPKRYPARKKDYANAVIREAAEILNNS